jgi:hypothetical protein
MTHAVPLESPKPSPMVNLGGMIGIAACSLGIAIFLAGCAGFAQAFQFGFLPLIASAAGLIVTILGGVIRKGGVEQTGIVASLFVNVFALVGGLLLFALSRGAPLFPQGVSQ